MFLTVLMAIAALVPPSEGARPAQPARGALAYYFSTDDYPPSALARGAEGVVRFQLEIGPDGLVKTCDILSSSGDPALDAVTCSILLGRARYTPARDAAGRPVIGRDVASVTWRLPPPEPGRPFARFVTISWLGSNGTGGLTCVVTTDGVADADATPNSCGDLANSGISELLQHAPLPIDVTLVSVAGPDDSGVEAVGADEASYGDLRYDYVSELVISQNGRVTGCRLISLNMPESAPLEDPGELCDIPPPGAPPLFEPANDPAPRRARLRWAFYVNGWPADWPALPPPVPWTLNER